MAQSPTRPGRRTIVICLAAAFAAASSSPAAATHRPPDQAPIEADAAAAPPAWDARFFREDLLFLRVTADVAVTLEDGRALIMSAANPDGGVLATLTAGADWQRAYPFDPELLTAYRREAEANLGRDLPDPNRCYHLRVADGVDGFELARALMKTPGVALCLPMPRPVPAPLPPNYEAIQDALLAAPGGFDSRDLWTWPNGNGQSVIVVDLEYSWSLTHQDVPPITLVGPTPNDPFNDNNHGTAVMGIIGSRRNGWGTTGPAHGSLLRASPTNTGGGFGVWDIGAALIRAMSGSHPGDVILIEQQFAGPNHTGFGQEGLVPIEWWEPWYDVVLLAVGNRRIVVEAGGNGGENLDAPIYGTGNFGHWPFLEARDSGAIIIGAGASPFSIDTDRSRLWYSNYGSRVDVQAHGEWTVAAGYGDLYFSEGPNLYYTQDFGGTSGASALVAAVCAQVQAVHKAAANTILTPAQMRDVLIATGSPQRSGTYPVSQQIGPRPNARAALESVFDTDDCNANEIPDAVEIGAGVVDDLNGNGVPDGCEPCPCERTGDATVDVFDLLAYLDLWFTADPGAELDGAAGIDVFDLLALLDCWFPASAGAPCP